MAREDSHPTDPERGIYPIGAAAERPGVPIETIRIWERRYGLLRPERTAGKHRLYSERDISVLRGARRLLSQGSRIGAVARMPIERLLEASEGRTAPLEPPGQWAEQLLSEAVSAARELDAQGLDTLLDRPLLSRVYSQVVLDFYLPLLARIGELWHAGEAGVRVEHLVEKAVSTRVSALFASHNQHLTGRPVLCAAPPNERHEVGLFAAALLLRAEEFPVVFLGADLPADELHAAIVKLEPLLLVMAVTNTLSRVAEETLAPVLNSDAMLHVALALGGPERHTLARQVRHPYRLCATLDELLVFARSLRR